MTATGLAAPTTAATPARVGKGAMARTIGMMWKRQMIRFIRSRSRILASLAQPILFLLAFGFGFNAVFEQAGQGSYIQFVGPGIVTMSVLFSSVFSGMEVMWDRQFGFLKETMVAPVPRSAIMLGRTLGGATVAVIQGVLVLVITMLVGLRPENWALVPLALLALVLISIMFTALGTYVATKLQDMQGFQLIMNFMIMPLFFLSGALFPLQGLPVVMEWIIRINPLGYGVDAVRGLLIGGNFYSLWLDFAVLVVLSAALVLLGAQSFRKMEA